LRLEYVLYENAQLKADHAELRAKYEEVVVQCERLVDEMSSCEPTKNI
jgi:hypothetical protein